MMKYCDVCGKEVKTKTISRQEVFNVCGEDITIEAQVLVCTDCGEELFCEELDSATLVNAYNEYRRKHKLLNYSDMIFYKENGISMSGLKYAHLQYGPVPENYDMIFGKMSADHIAHIEVVYNNGYEKHQVIPECDIPEGILSEEEMDVLERVFVKFKDFGSADISDYSHKEKGYCSTKQGEIISYSYAKDIQLN